MKPVLGSTQPLGTDGDHRRRFLFHHLPLGLVSALLLVVFMTAPLFDARAYAHVDIMSGLFPQSPGDGGPMGPAAVRDSDRDGAQTRSRDHGGDHAGRTSHSGHGQPGVRPRAEPESTVHAGRDAGSRHGSNTEQRDQRADLSLSRRVQQFTVATGYLGVAFLALTLLLGPANLLLRRRNPVSSYLRRDVGIWTAIFSIIHVIAAVLMHVSHGSGVISSSLHFFVNQDGRPLTNSFGLDSHPVEVSAAQNSDRVVIRVTDDGPGIPEHDMPNLFEPFCRLDRSRSKKTGGYGLGLSIAKRIVEAHGGSIAVENNPTRGASFVMSLPKAG
jgi:preprotein translocase subunit SecG